MCKKLHSARNRIIVKLIIMLAFSFTIYGAYAFYNTFESVLDNNYATINLMSDVTIETLNQELSMIRNTTYTLSGSDTVRNWIYNQDYFQQGSKEGYLNQEKLKEETQKILIDNNVWNFELFDYVTIYHNDRMLAYAHSKPYSLQKIIEDTKGIVDLLKQGDSYARILPPSEEDQTIYTTLRIQADFQNDDSLYVIGATREEYFNKSICNAITYEGTIIYVTDSNGIIYSTNDAGKLGKTIPELRSEKKRNGKTKVKYNDTNYWMIQKKINDDFSYVYLLPQSELVKQTIGGMKVFIYLSSILAIVLIGASVFGTVKTTKFVSDFAIAMGRVRDNDYDTKMKKYDNQELDELVDTFNSMTYEIKTLLQKTSESKQLLDEMEIKFLQHQMNPHFLFNILLTIQIKAKMSGDETIYRMISSLATLLRAGIYVDKRATITIREELKHVEYYLSLQKERYEDRLSYYIQIEDESILECEIPRLIIEPIAENAIVHGVENTAEQAVVSVSLNYEKEDIVIHVIDNGIGFDVDEVMHPSPNSEEKQEKREKVGLNNTDQRLKLIYGENYGLRIQSKKNEGTDIEIRVPKKRLGNLDDKSSDCG